MKTLFRAKRIDSDEYIQGYLFEVWNKSYILWGTTNDVPNMIEIDKNTLAMHIDYMIDANGKEIFASLSKDGLGGDIGVGGDEYDIKFIWDQEMIPYFQQFSDYTIKGIKQ